MDGRGRWLDNVFIERLWRSLKYEEVYLKGYADGREARAGIAPGSVFTRTSSSPSAHGRTPMAVWREGVNGTLANNAVDMTLRLDDARPSRQPQQQQQTPQVA
jgi:putative transposase